MPELPPNHPVVRISVTPHSLSYSLSRDGQQIREENNLQPTPATFDEIHHWCLRGGFFDVRVAVQCDSPVLIDSCAIYCKKYNWNLLSCP